MRYELVSNENISSERIDKNDKNYKQKEVKTKLLIAKCLERE